MKILPLHPARISPCCSWCPLLLLPPLYTSEKSLALSFYLVPVVTQCFVLKIPKLNSIIFNLTRIEWDNKSTAWTVGYPIATPAKHVYGLHCCKNALLTPLVQLVFHTEAQVLHSVKLHSSQEMPRLKSCMILVRSGCRSLCLPKLNFIQFLSSPLSVCIDPQRAPHPPAFLHATVVQKLMKCTP